MASAYESLLAVHGQSFGISLAQTEMSQLGVNLKADYANAPGRAYHIRQGNETKALLANRPGGLYGRKH